MILEEGETLYEVMVHKLVYQVSALLQSLAL